MTPTLLRPDEVVDDLRRREFLGVLAAAGLLAGCGPDRGRSGQASASYPRTVGHAGGDLVVPERPGRVVVAGPYSELDVLLALGVEPAGVGEDGQPFLPWQRQAGAEDAARFAASGGPDLEALAAVRPDLMVMNGTTYQGYPEWVEQYSKVCPVLGMPDTVEEQVRTVAEALGTPGDVVGDVTAGVRERVEAFRPGRRPTSIVVANYYTGGQIIVWTPSSPHAALMRRLGLPDLSAPEPPADDPRAQVVPVSLERIDLLDADLLLVAQAVDDDPAVDELEALPAFANLPVVREGRYVRQTVAETFAVGDVTVLSLPTAIAAMERALA